MRTGPTPLKRLRRWLIPVAVGTVVALPVVAWRVPALRGVPLRGLALPGAASPGPAPIPGAGWRKLYVAADRSVEIAPDRAGFRPRGNVVLAWVRFSYRSYQLDAHQAAYRSMLQLWAYECDGGRQALMQFAELSGGAGGAGGASEAGQVVASGSRHSYDWSYPEPDTIGEAAMKIACTPEWKRPAFQQRSA